MEGKTHIITGITAYVAVAGLDPAGIAVAAAASKLPDIDLVFKNRAHRKVTHSLLALITLGYITNTAFPDISLPVIIGYGSHLVLDTLTPAGIPWLWPIKTKYKIPVTKTGSIGDRLIRYLSMIVLVVLLMKETTIFL